MNVIGTAAHEYFSRPADERYSSLDSLIDAARTDQQHSRELGYNLKDLQAVAVGKDGGIATADDTLGSVQLASPKGQATFSHWSFGQICRMIGAPASYLRQLPPALGADCLNDGIQKTAIGTKATVLAQVPNGRAQAHIRSVTSQSYGRLWDGDLFRGLRDAIGSKFELPPTWEGGTDGPRGGAYRGDRDSFVIMVDGGSIVNDPSIRGNNGQMFRGIMVRNSEVGACSVTIERVLFEYICGNHNLWGAVIDKRFRRRHIGSHVLRDVVREIGNIAVQWTNRSAEADEKIIRFLIDTELASTKEAIVDELRDMGSTKEQAEQAYDRVERSEIYTASPRSFWGLSQGLTELSQASNYQDERFDLDLVAGKLLARGARLVAA